MVGYERVLGVKVKDLDAIVGVPDSLICRSGNFESWVNRQGGPRLVFPVLALRV